MKFGKCMGTLVGSGSQEAVYLKYWGVKMLKILSTQFLNDLDLIFLSRGLGVEFSITTKGTGQSEPYKWGLWITQIKCDGSRFLEAPKGCFQYYMGSTGSFSSFNYENGAYLNNQVRVHTTE